MSNISYQLGDQPIMIGDDRYYLRLTLGALAEISEFLPANGPKALARQMKSLTLDKVMIVLLALLRPIYGHNSPALNQTDIKPNHVKVIAKLFETSFSVLK